MTQTLPTSVKPYFTIGVSKLAGQALSWSRVCHQSSRGARIRCRWITFTYADRTADFIPFQSIGTVLRAGQHWTRIAFTYGATRAVIESVVVRAVLAAFQFAAVLTTGRLTRAVRFG